MVHVQLWIQSRVHQPWTAQSSATIFLNRQSERVRTCSCIFGAVEQCQTYRRSNSPFTLCHQCVPSEILFYYCKGAKILLCNRRFPAGLLNFVCSVHQQQRKDWTPKRFPAKVCPKNGRRCIGIVPFNLCSYCFMLSWLYMFTHTLKGKCVQLEALSFWGYESSLLNVQMFPGCRNFL